MDVGYHGIGEGQAHLGDCYHTKWESGDKDQFIFKTSAVAIIFIELPLALFFFLSFLF